MQALYSAEVDQVSGGISDSEAREVVFQTRLEAMIQDSVNGRPFTHHDVVLLCIGVAALLALPAAFYVIPHALESVYYGARNAITFVRNMEFISCDDKGNCCCPAGG